MSIPELSLCFNPDQQASFLMDLLKSLNDPSLRDLQLNIHEMPWEDYKEELVSMALHNRGADVSQVGFPLTEDLVAMNALLPISPQLLSKLGGATAFHPTIWDFTRRHQEGRLWALPWLADPRALFYWKDLVDKAGVDPDSAFRSSASIDEAFGRMQAKGMPTPWVLGMREKFVMIHAISSWVWGSGGDFASPTETRSLFLEQPALDGFEAFFKLGKYMPPENTTFANHESHRYFLDRKAVATIADYGSLARFRAALAPEMRDLLGVALPPGPPLLAGSDLVCWRHSRKDEEVSNLLRALFSTDVQVKYTEYLGVLPVTNQALEKLASSGDPNIKTFIETLDTGRLFAVTKFGGMLEVQLASALTGLWAAVSQHPADNLRETIQKSLEPVRRRFDMLLSEL